LALRPPRTASRACAADRADEAGRLPRDHYGLPGKLVPEDHVAVASPTIAARVIAELDSARRPLDDDELAGRLGVQPRQTINQVCRRLERSGHLDE
jgi:hypothetical protein